MVSSSWQGRTGSMEERFGLLDDSGLRKYKAQPVFQEPEGSLPKGKLTALGVTSGVGSMLIGAHQQGFRVLGNIEWRDYYRWRDDTGNGSFLNYFPGAWMSRGLHDVPIDLLPSEQIDFVAGHPECGLYSLLAKPLINRGTTYDPTDVGDIPLFLKLVSLLQPRYFLMDDLPGSFEALPMAEYIKLLPDYDLYPEWISNWAYGNIQKHRNRMFIVAARKKERFVFVPGEEEHDLVLSDVIDDLLKFKAGEIANHQDVDASLMVKRYTHLQFRGQYMTWAEARDILKEHPEIYKNITYMSEAGVLKHRPGMINPQWDGACPTLTGGYTPLHPKRFLPLSVRERARIQGFPDDYIFYSDPDGPWAKHWAPYTAHGQRAVKQTGKAMPIQFCEYVARQVKASIEKKPFRSSGERVLKPNPRVTKAKVDFCTLQGYADQERACQYCWHRSECELYPELKEKEVA